MSTSGDLSRALADTLYASLDGTVLTSQIVADAVLDMGGEKIVNLGAPSDATDAAQKGA
jgi:hypothetical protein